MRSPGTLVLLVLAAVRQRQREAARGGALQAEVLQRGAQRAARVGSVLQPSLGVLGRCATERVCMQKSQHIYLLSPENQLCPNWQTIPALTSETRRYAKTMTPRSFSFIQFYFNVANTGFFFNFFFCFASTVLEV